MTLVITHIPDAVVSAKLMEGRPSGWRTRSSVFSANGAALYQPAGIAPGTGARKTY